MSTNVQLDEASIKAGLTEIMEQIHNGIDPDELNAYRAVFRKHVSFFNRAYVAAFLLRQIYGTATTKSNGTSSKNRGPRKSVTPVVNGTPNTTPETNQSQNPAPSREGMVSVFIGIGKSRKVYPRDIISLLTEQGSLDKEEIGSIKILDNYSFAEIQEEKAAMVIEKLNSLEYRGRALAVNFAKKRD